MKSTHKLFAIVFSTALLAGCGSSHLSGNYEGTDSGHTFALKFHDSTVEVDLDGKPSGSDNYEIKDGKVYISTAEGKGTGVAFNIEDNDCLVAPHFGELCKKP